MNEVQRQAEKAYLIEDLGILFEESGVPRMAGRILGWLLICNPPYQSAAELSVVVGGSKGAISSMTRLLIQAGLVERIGIPSNRATYYRTKPRSWSELLRRRMAMLTAMGDLAERGLALMADEDAEVRQRLEEIRDFYAFFEQELPALMERWQKQRKEAESCRDSTGARL